MSVSTRKDGAVAIRTSIRDYIRNERDPIVIKWRALEERCESEDRTRSKFVRRKFMEDSEVPPVVVRKFIGSLRHSVRAILLKNGGTPYSIIRNLFLYWDADNSGSLGVNGLDHVMKSLGCRLSKEDLQGIVTYYNSGTGENKMEYSQLLVDIDRGEPNLIECTSALDDKEGVRFQNVADDWHDMPENVSSFLGAFRDYISKRMRVAGGTPQEHAMPIFLKFDKEIKGGLTPAQLRVAVRQHLHLHMDEQQAIEITKFYDRKFRGILEPQLFMTDLCGGVQSILHFTELSSRQIAAQKKAILENPFTIKPFQTKPNKVLEKFKVETLKVLDAKVYNIGGSKRGWLREAFRFWDPRDLGVLTNYTHLQGAVKRLGLTLPDSDARCLMKEYDSQHNGTLDYNILINDVVSSDPHFLDDATHIDSVGGSSSGRIDQKISARAPQPATKGIQRFKSAADAYAWKSQGRVEPRDVLHGTFLRFDRGLEGRVDDACVRGVCGELGIRLNEHDLQTFITWFDTNGSDMLDYNELVRQIYGADVSTRALKLPPVPSPNKDARSKIAALQKASTSPERLGAGSSTISIFVTGCVSGGVHSPTKPTTVPSPAAAHVGVSNMGVGTRTLERNLQDIESRAVKEARKAERRQKIMEEKACIQQKLDSIERQRKLILEDHRLAQKKKNLAGYAS